MSVPHPVPVIAEILEELAKRIENQVSYMYVPGYPANQYEITLGNAIHMIVTAIRDTAKELR